jgi:hypothetical protein
VHRAKVDRSRLAAEQQQWASGRPSGWAVRLSMYIVGVTAVRRIRVATVWQAKVEAIKDGADRYENAFRKVFLGGSAFEDVSFHFVSLESLPQQVLR